MKNFFLTTIILILAPLLIFVPVYILLIYTANTNVKDYSDDILGRWSAYQYYYENQRVACNADIWMSMEIDDKTIVVDGTILPQAESDYTWGSNASINYNASGTACTFLISFDSNGNLKIIVDGTSYIILLRKSEE